MKVLYVLDEQGGKPTIGGSCRELCEMVIALRDGYGVEPIVAASVEDSNTGRLRDAGVDVRIVPYGSFMIGRPWATWKILPKWLWSLFRYACLTPWGIIRLRRELDFSIIDLIHTNINRTDFGARLAAHFGIPHVWHIREFPDLFFRCWSYRSHPGEYISKLADRVICVSEAVRQHWITVFRLDERNSCVVYDGVDESGFIEKTNRQDCEIRLVIVGNISESKGQFQVVKAFSSMPDAIRAKAKLDIFGAGDSKCLSRINQLIIDTGLHGRVNLKGPVDNVPEVLADYDIGITASIAEGFGRVTIEYMMAGLAVVASDAGANRELLTDRSGQLCGLLYDFEDCDSLTNCLERLIDDAELRSHLSGCGKLRGYEFTAGKNAEAVYNIYKTMLAHDITNI